MGTSTSHRSPATAEWDRVRELYLQPNPSPGEIVSRIVTALDEAARQRMHAASAVGCLDAVLHGSAQLAVGDGTVFRFPGAPAALDLATSLQEQAQQGFVEDRSASVMGALALQAIPPTVISTLGGMPAWEELPVSTVAAQFGRYAREENLSDLTGLFLSHDFDQVFRYLVTRDLSDFIGQGAALTVGQGAALVDRVGDLCRERAVFPGLRRRDPDLLEIVHLPREKRRSELAPVVRQGVLAGLADLAGG
jgi:hypothetical protein